MELDFHWNFMNNFNQTHNINNGQADGKERRTELGGATTEELKEKLAKLKGETEKARTEQKTS